MRRKDGGRDRRDPAPGCGEVRGWTRRQFHAWAAVVRASVQTIQALAEAAREKERALADLLHGPRPLSAVIDSLTLDIETRHAEIARIIDELPALDDIREAGEPGRSGRALSSPRAHHADSQADSSASSIGRHPSGFAVRDFPP